jgi:hypothetical protein
MKLPFTRNTLELPPEPAAAEAPPIKPLVEIIADVLHERLPRGPVPDLREFIETISPDISQSRESVSRRWISEAIELLPIEDFVAQIEGAAKPVLAAREKLATVSRDLRLLNAQAEEMSASGDFDPSAFAEIRGKISALQSRLADAMPLRQATDKLVHVIEEVGAKIRPLARLQTGRSPSIGSWFGSASHAGNGAKVILDPVVRATRILEIADTALEELARLQRGELPEPFPRNPNGVSSEREHVVIRSISFWID